MPINDTLFNAHNYVMKFRFQRYTYLNKSILTTAPSQSQRLLSCDNNDNNNVFFSFDRILKMDCFFSFQSKINIKKMENFLEQRLNSFRLRSGDQTQCRLDFQRQVFRK